MPYWSIAQSPSADLLQTSNRTIATCLYSLPSLLKGRFINHPSIMSNGIWGNLLLKKKTVFLATVHCWHSFLAMYLRTCAFEQYKCLMLFNAGMMWRERDECRVGSNWGDVCMHLPLHFLACFSTRYCNPCCI